MPACRRRNRFHFRPGPVRRAVRSTATEGEGLSFSFILRWLWFSEPAEGKPSLINLRGTSPRIVPDYSRERKDFDLAFCLSTSKLTGIFIRRREQFASS